MILHVHHILSWEGEDPLYVDPERHQVMKGSPFIAAPAGSWSLPWSPWQKRKLECYACVSSHPEMANNQFSQSSLFRLINDSAELQWGSHTWRKQMEWLSTNIFVNNAISIFDKSQHVILWNIWCVLKIALCFVYMLCDHFLINPMKITWQYSLPPYKLKFQGVK